MTTTLQNFAISLIVILSDLLKSRVISKSQENYLCTGLIPSMLTTIEHSTPLTLRVAFCVCCSSRGRGRNKIGKQPRAKYELEDGVN